MLVDGKQNFCENHKLLHWQDKSKRCLKLFGSFGVINSLMSIYTPNHWVNTSARVSITKDPSLEKRLN